MEHAGGDTAERNPIDTILHGQERGVDGLGTADIHQRTQHTLLLVGIRRDCHAAITPVLIQQPPDKKYSFFSLIHNITPSYRTIFPPKNEVGSGDQNS